MSEAIAIGRSKKSATREQLIDATERLICEAGLSGLTTKMVARECGMAEGTIYRHFSSREELVVTTIRERLPGEFAPHINALFERAGTATIEENLRTFVAAIVPIYSIIAPTLGMLAADPGLAARNAAALHADGSGPGRTLESLTEYFVTEQRTGRIDGDIDARTAAGMLLAFCFYRSLMQHLFRDDPTRLSDEAFARELSTILGRGVKVSH